MMCKYDLFPPSAAFFLITSQFYKIIVFMTRCPEEGKHICLIASKKSWRMEVQQARILCFIPKSKRYFLTLHHIQGAIRPGADLSGVCRPAALLLPAPPHHPLPAPAAHSRQGAEPLQVGLFLCVVSIASIEHVLNKSAPSR